MNKWLFFLVFFLCLPVWFSYPQGHPSSVYVQQEYLEGMKNENPELYKFEKRIVDIQIEITKLLKEYKITDSSAKRSQIKERLESLLKENMEIRNNPAYQVELMVLDR